MSITPRSAPGSAARLAPPALLLLLAAALGACGGETGGTAGPGGAGAAQGPSAAGRGPWTAADPAVAGPAIHAELLRAFREKDAQALLALMSERHREQGRRRARSVRADLAKEPGQAQRVQEALKLAKSPLDMTDDELMEQDLAVRLRERDNEDFYEQFGREFLDARALGDRLLLRTRLAGAAARKAPGGIAEAVLVREDGAWRFDAEATKDHVARWVRSLPLPPGGYTHVAVTPDGRQVVVAGSHGLRLLPFEGEGPTVHVPVPWVSRLHVDPAGAWVATASLGGSLPAEPGRDGAATEEAAAEPPVAEEAVPEPPPADPHRGIVLWRLPGGERLRALTDDPQDAAAFSPDARRLVLETYDDQGSRVVLLDVASGERTPGFALGGLRVLAFVGEDALALTGERDEVRIVGLDGKRRLTIPGIKVEGPRHVAADPQGGRLATLSTLVEDGISRRVVVVLGLADGDELWRADSSWGEAVAFSPDRREVASGDEPLFRYDAATGAVVGRHGREGTRNRGPFAYHPSGRYVVTLAQEEPEGPPEESAPGGARPQRRWFVHVFSTGG